MNIQYSSLIRTFNSEVTLPATLHFLEKQTIPPSEYVIVDSGSKDSTINLLPKSAILHIFSGHEFNFSIALNQGLEHISTDYVLIISSHTLLQEPSAIEYALALLISNESIGAAYFCEPSSGELRHTLINKANFNGYNGLWNTCSLIKMELLKKRNFRPDVFSAEDQEWANWLFTVENKTVARIEGARMESYTRNRNVKSRKAQLYKRLNEYISIAYFTKRELLGFRNLSHVAYEIIKPIPPLWSGKQERLFNFLLFCRLVSCYVAKPKYKSKYF